MQYKETLPGILGIKIYRYNCIQNFINKICNQKDIICVGDKLNAIYKKYYNNSSELCFAMYAFGVEVGYRYENIR